MAPAVCLIALLTWQFFHSPLSKARIVPTQPEQPAREEPLPAAQAQTLNQPSPTEATAAFLERKLQLKLQEKKLLAENKERIKNILNETEQSFAEIKQRREVDPVSFVKEASQRASLYLQCDEKQKSYDLYKESLRSLKMITPSPDTSDYESPLWQFLQEYLKKTTSRAEEKDAIDRIIEVSDRKDKIPYYDGASRVSAYFEAIGRKQDAFDFAQRVIGLQLKNRPEDIDYLTAWYWELEKLGAELKQNNKVEKIHREILSAAEKYHPAERAAIIVPVANFSAFCIKNNNPVEGTALAARALELAKQETSACLLDKIAVIPDAYTAQNKLDESESFLRQATELKRSRFKNEDLNNLRNSFSELKTKYEDRNDWSHAESLLELFRLAQEPGKYSEMCMLQDLFFCYTGQASYLQGQGKTSESQEALRKADNAYLKVKEFFLKEPDQAATLAWLQTRQNRLRSLKLNDNLANQ